MSQSRLIPIIQRLQAMQEDQGEDLQVRRFEKDGTEKCQVTYNQKTKTFLLDDTATKESFEFDNVDYIAIEILELLQNAEDLA